MDFQERRPAIMNIEPVLPGMSESSNKCIGTVGGGRVVGACPIELSTHRVAACLSWSSHSVVQDLALTPQGKQRFESLVGARLGSWSRWSRYV
jgi:hypothetical protein